MNAIGSVAPKTSTRNNFLAADGKSKYTAQTPPLYKPDTGIQIGWETAAIAAVVLGGTAVGISAVTKLIK